MVCFFEDEQRELGYFREVIGMHSGVEELLSVAKKKYSDIFGKIEHTHTINGVDVNLRFKYIQFDPNGEPKIRLLIDTLVGYFTHYCFSAQKRNIDPDLPQSEQDWLKNKLQTEARKLYRKWIAGSSTSGEAGEMILWFLLEAVLQAPQIVAKMDLKTNPQLESFGSDGIHMKIIEGVLNIYFGEAKLYRDVSGALNSIFESIESFHKNGLYIHEYNMVTKHYKYLYQDDQKKIFDFLTDSVNKQEVKINHACLVGYDWQEYQKLDTEERESFIKNFQELYKTDTNRLTKLIQNRFDGFSKRYLHFEVFFLPFKSVQELRDKFNEEL